MKSANVTISVYFDLPFISDYIKYFHQDLGISMVWLKMVCFKKIGSVKSAIREDKSGLP